MHITIQEILGGSAATSLWIIYGAVCRHWPAQVPRSLQDWWSWTRSTNQEIAAQHQGAGNPTQPVEPAN